MLHTPVSTLTVSDTFGSFIFSRTALSAGCEGRGYNRHQTNAGQHLQAPLMWEALLTPITYSLALQGPIFITSIIFNHKYSNADLKSKA